MNNGNNIKSNHGKKKRKEGKTKKKWHALIAIHI